MRDDDTRPCQSEITGTTGKILRYHVINKNDWGKTIKLYGFKYGNQPLQEKDADGNTVMGITITATKADAESAVLVTQITSVVRQATQSRTWLYEVDPTGLNLLAMYEPGETNPSYRCSHINNICSLPDYTDSYGRKMRQCTALVKLEFVPVVSDDDFIMLDNLDALELGIEGLRAERANDDVLANIKYARAIQELNMELRNRNPSEQTVVRTNDMSSDYVMTNPI